MARKINRMGESVFSVKRTHWHHDNISIWITARPKELGPGCVTVVQSVPVSSCGGDGEAGTGCGECVV